MAASTLKPGTPSDAERAQLDRDGLIEKLTESNAAFEHFAYVAAHDMQEPLRAMSSFSDILASDYADKLDDDGKLYLKLIRDAAARMQVMVVDLLDYARLGKQAPFAPFDAAPEYAAVLEALAGAIEEKKAHISAGSLPRLTGDTVQFSRLLQNLIGNGIKYAHAGMPPEISISAADEGDHWLFAVADNGIGIDAANLERIFEPFKRLHSRQKYAGTGLGLSACRKIVENHGGKIWCVSVIGKGTTFYFTWPKEDAHLGR
jgi:light-regulated signal transduction histidine kinase (bacteriophytochrome)